jgi:hypothetical protein
MATILTLIAVLSTAPFSISEMSSPLGTITSKGNVTVGNSTAPTGTTIFTGDRVVSSQPALIDFGSGSRVEVTKAAATFAREGKTLVIKADRGLLRFNFVAGEDVRIDTGDYRITSEESSGSMGELGLNGEGQMVLDMRSGRASILDRTTGRIASAVPGRPVVMLAEGGNGLISENGKSVTDASKKFKANELKGMCIVGGKEAYPVTGNSSSRISIKGKWEKDGGVIEYQIVECTQEAITRAGASAEAAKAAVDAAAGIAHGSRLITAAAIAGVMAGAGVGVGVWEATKSPSSR